MFKVLVTDAISEEGLAKLKEADDIQLDIKVGLKPEEIIATIGDYDALLVRSQTKVTAPIIAAGKNLKVIGRAGVGVDNIDVHSATKAGVLVINAPDGNTITTAEFTFAMMMALARHIPQAHATIHEGKWDRNHFVGVELRGKTLGVVGLGRIGAEVGKRAQAFGMTVYAYDPFLTAARAEKLGVKMATLDQTIQVADFVTVHTPLMKETHHLIGAKEFGMMKKGVRVINCARGGIIDEAALKTALEDGTVIGAALDVYEEEPPKENPLLSFPQVITTPHLGASTSDAQLNVAIDVADGLVKLLHGEFYPHTVNLPAMTSEAKIAVEPYVELGEILGSMAAQIAQGGADKITIRYEGEATKHAFEPITRAVLKGVLTRYYQEEVHLISAALIAEEMGIEVLESKSSQHSDYTNFIQVELEGPKGRVSVAGTVLKGHGPRVVEIDGYPVDILPSSAMLITWHKDRPGIIGLVGSVLGEAGVNIASMQVGRQAEGGQAIMIIGVDRNVSDEPLQFLGTTKDIERILYLELPIA